MKGNKTQKGITMVALIITIIVLLILAVVAVSSITDENGGLIAKVEQAVSRWEQAGLDENTQLQNYYNYINSINLGTTVDPETGACTTHVYDGSGACKNCGETITLEEYMGGDLCQNTDECEDAMSWIYIDNTYGPGVQHATFEYCGNCLKPFEDSPVHADCFDGDDDDNKCDICNETMHVHEFTTEMHPRRCTNDYCGVGNACVSDGGVAVDANNDGICDNCTGVLCTHANGYNGNDHESAVCKDCNEACTGTGEKVIDSTQDPGEGWHGYDLLCNVCGKLVDNMYAQTEKCYSNDDDGKCDLCGETIPTNTVACTKHRVLVGESTCIDCGTSLTYDVMTVCDTAFDGIGCSADDVDIVVYDTEKFGEPGVMHEETTICGTCHKTCNELGETGCSDSDDDGKCDGCEATMSN